MEISKNLGLWKQVVAIPLMVLKLSLKNRDRFTHKLSSTIQNSNNKNNNSKKVSNLQNDQQT